MFRSVRDTRRLLHAARVLARHDALVPREYAERTPFPLKVAQFFFGGPRKADIDVPPGVRLARALESKHLAEKDIKVVNTSDADLAASASPVIRTSSGARRSGARTPPPDWASTPTRY